MVGLLFVGQTISVDIVVCVVANSVPVGVRRLTRVRREGVFSIGNSVPVQVAVGVVTRAVAIRVAPLFWVIRRPVV